MADLTIVGVLNNKKQVNQNVMYETGYAIAKKRDASCILLQNADQCEVKELSFDLAQRRVSRYSKESNDLKEKLLDILPLYIENIKLKRNQAPIVQSLSPWEEKIMTLFKTIQGEKRIIVSRVGQLNFGIYGQYNTSLANELQRHSDPQEIRAAFANLVDNKYLEVSHNERRIPTYKPLQKGYAYIKRITP